MNVLKASFIITLLCCLFDARPGPAQNYFPQTATMAGMAGTGAHLPGISGIFGNPAGLYRTANREFMTGFDNRFGVAGMNALTAAVALPLAKYGVGAGISRFGDRYYNEQKISAGIGHRIDFVSLGLSADVLQVSMDEYGTGHRAMLHFGGIARPIKNVFFSAYGHNLNRARLSQVGNRYLPTVLHAALGYEPDSSFTLIASVKKDLEYAPAYSIGTEYRMRKFLYLRSGIQLHPLNVTAGFTFRHAGLGLDYASAFHPRLGFSNFVALNYIFKSKDERPVTD